VSGHLNQRNTKAPVGILLVCKETLESETAFPFASSSLLSDISVYIFQFLSLASNIDTTGYVLNFARNFFVVCEWIPQSLNIIELRAVLFSTVSLAHLILF